METLFIEPTEKTPLIVLDRSNAKFEIIGVSIPQDGTSFYQPILQWWDAYLEKPLANTQIVLNLDYFNISSSKMILFVFYRLMELKKKGKKVSVEWFYNDADLLEAGQDFADMTQLEFTFVEVSKKFLVV